MGVYLWKERLPSTYQEVEYIQSSGTQYINTNYNPKTTTEFEIDYYINSYVGQYASPFGTRYAHNDQAYYIGYENNNSYYGFGNNKANTSTVTFSGVGTRKHITYHNNILSNGNESVTVATNQQPYGNMVIFAENNQGTVKEFADIKLYSFKLREGSTLIRDYIPCYRKSDSVIGLYDLVNNQFYTNAGSGTFTKGSDVNGVELKNAYIGEWIGYTEYSYNLVTAGSVAQMQSDGWTFERQSGVTPTSGWQFTTNGLHNTNTGSSNKFGWVKNIGAINCTNAKKITIQAENYLVSGSLNGASTYRIFLNGVSGSAGGSINSMNNSGYNGYAGASPSTTTWNRVTLRTGNYTGTTILDLENKTEVMSLTGKTDINLTLSDSDIEKIRNYTDIQLYYDNVGNYYKSIYIKIEY